MRTITQTLAQGFCSIYDLQESLYSLNNECLPVTTPSELIFVPHRQVIIKIKGNISKYNTFKYKLNIHTPIDQDNQRVWKQSMLILTLTPFNRTFPCIDLDLLIKQIKHICSYLSINLNKDE